MLSTLLCAAWKTLAFVALFVAAYFLISLSPLIGILLAISTFIFGFWVAAICAKALGFHLISALENLSEKKETNS